MLPITAPPGSLAALDQLQDFALNEFTSPRAFASALPKRIKEFESALADLLIQRLDGKRLAEPPAESKPANNCPWQGHDVVAFADLFLEPMQLLEETSSERLGRTWSRLVRKLTDELHLDAVRDFNPKLKDWLDSTEAAVAQLLAGLPASTSATIKRACEPGSDPETVVQAITVLDELRTLLHSDQDQAPITIPASPEYPNQPAASTASRDVPARSITSQNTSTTEYALERLFGMLLQAGAGGEWFLYDHGGSVIQEALKHPLLVREVGTVALTMQPWLVLRDDSPLIDHYMEWVSAKPQREDGDGW